MLKNVAPKETPGSVRRARRLRLEMSLPELLLWQKLRGSLGGLKFRCQHPEATARLPRRHPAKPGGPPPRDELEEEPR